MLETKLKTFLIALGGNSILRAGQKGTIEEQYANLAHTSETLVDLLATGQRFVITHGNGPQVGNILLSSELSRDSLPPMALHICSACTQGFMGFLIQNALANSLRLKGLKHNITAVITQVIVDENDPAFGKPTKPIGPFYTLEEARQLREEKGWAMIEDSKRGYRRVVPSPMPMKVQQARIIKSMLDAGEVVIAVGGGGIPSKRREDGCLEGVDAIIDKDYASSRLAIEIGADTLVFLTAVDKVYLDFGLPGQKGIYLLTTADAERLLGSGQFGVGSMEPKIRAAIQFLRADGEAGMNWVPANERQVIITDPECLNDALQGKTGTRMVR